MEEDYNPYSAEKQVSTGGKDSGVASDNLLEMMNEGERSGRSRNPKPEVLTFNFGGENAEKVLRDDDMPLPKTSGGWGASSGSKPPKLSSSIRVKDENDDVENSGKAVVKRPFLKRGTRNPVSTKSDFLEKAAEKATQEAQKAKVPKPQISTFGGDSDDELGSTFTPAPKRKRTLTT